MPDPITTFGAAAGAVQLADVALRASREAYSFLCAVKDAKKDIRILRECEMILIVVRVQQAALTMCDSTL